MRIADLAYDRSLDNGVAQQLASDPLHVGAVSGPSIKYPCARSHPAHRSVPARPLRLARRSRTVGLTKGRIDVNFPQHRRPFRVSEEFGQTGRIVFFQRLAKLGQLAGRIGPGPPARWPGSTAEFAPQIGVSRGNPRRIDPAAGYQRQASGGVAATSAAETRCGRWLAPATRLIMF